MERGEEWREERRDGERREEEWREERRDGERREEEWRDERRGMEGGSGGEGGGEDRKGVINSTLSSILKYVLYTVLCMYMYMCCLHTSETKCSYPIPPPHSSVTPPTAPTHLPLPTHPLTSIRSHRSNIIVLQVDHPVGVFNDSTGGGRREGGRKREEGREGEGVEGGAGMTTEE